MWFDITKQTVEKRYNDVSIFIYVFKMFKTKWLNLNLSRFTVTNNNRLY